MHRGGMSDDVSSTDTNIIPQVRMRSGRPMESRRSPGDDRAYISSQDVFSDEEFDDVTPSSSNLRTAYEARSTPPPPPPPAEAKKAQKVSFSLPPHHAEGGNKDETDEVEQELDLFSKAIHISNIDEIDHVGLMRGMHERFQRKQEKWQRYASNYSKWAFGINFAILVLQIIQMLFHQLVEVFGGDSLLAQEQDGSSNSQSRSYYSYTGASTESSVQHVMFNPASLRAVRCVLSGATAAFAGLQMKLKLTEKSEKYRRGAKVYARLHRLSTYYLMLAENGGKVEDVTGLWRDAMKKEGKWIPAVKTFMAT